MKLEKGIVSFDYDGTRFNVPISEPWDVYTDDDDCVYIDSDNESKVDRTIDPLNFFTIHLTERCNLKCTYCFEGDKGNKDFTSENIDQFIQFVKENKLKDITIRFFGGEPLLNIPIIKNIIKTVEYNLSDVKVNYNIFTNGTILNDDVINLIKEKNIVIFVSLDGTKDSHNKNRVYINGKGTYDHIIKNIETIQEKTNKRVMARAIIDPDLENISLAYLKRDLYEKGVDVVSIEFPWVKDSDDMSLNEEKLSKIIKNIREYGYEFISSIKKDDYSIIGLAPFSKTLKDLINRTNVASSRACCAGSSSMAITVNGDLYPCHTFVGHEEFRMGSLTEGITNKNINDIFRNYSADTVEQCKKCEIQYNCTRRCPADSFLFNGDIYKPNEFRCKLQKEFFKTTMYIYYELSKMKDKKRMVQIMYNKLNEYNKNM